MRKHLSELIISVIVLIYGVFMLLAGLNTFPFSVSEAAFVATCTCLLLASAVVATVQKNPIGLFFTLVFAVLLVAAAMLALGYSSRNVYPLYIASVFVGGMGVSPKLTYKRFFFVSAVLTLASLILLIESFGVLNFSAVMPILIIYFAIIGILYASLKLKKRKSDKEEQ